MLLKACSKNQDTVKHLSWIFTNRKIYGKILFDDTYQYCKGAETYSEPCQIFKIVKLSQKVPSQMFNRCLNLKGVFLEVFCIFLSHCKESLKRTHTILTQCLVVTKKSHILKLAAFSCRFVVACVTFLLPPGIKELRLGLQAYLRPSQIIFQKWLTVKVLTLSTRKLNYGCLTTQITFTC